MGQYFLLVNLDKKEVISPHKLGGGLKLYEWMMNETARVFPFVMACGDDDGGAIRGRWAGDKVILAGDYDKPTIETPEGMKTAYDLAHGWVDITDSVIEEFNAFVGTKVFPCKFEAMNMDMVLVSHGVGENHTLHTNVKTKK
mgnify:FL=1